MKGGDYLFNHEKQSNIIYGYCSKNIYESNVHEGESKKNRPV